MNNDTKQKVQGILEGMLERIIRKRTITEPVTEAAIQQSNPFGYLLVPFPIWKASKFERSFVTSLGQTCFEQIAKVIAEGTGAYAERQHDEEISLNTWRMDQVTNILRGQRASETHPNWQLEVDSILALNTPASQTINVKFDLYVRRVDGQEEYYSMKTVKPNLDQTETAKKDMLHIKAAKPLSRPFFALPFNPAGEGGNYKSVHSIPYQLFDMDDEDAVLIGASFWNTVGADENTYRELIEIFEKVGETYSERIRLEFLEA